MCLRQPCSALMTLKSKDDSLSDNVTCPGQLKKSELFFADDETIACFRSTKTIRIPKKVLFLTLTKERNGYIVRQVAKNKEPSHKGWDLAPKESTYNLKLITAGALL